MLPMQLNWQEEVEQRLWRIAWLFVDYGCWVLSDLRICWDELLDFLRTLFATFIYSYIQAVCLLELYQKPLQFRIEKEQGGQRELEVSRLRLTSASRLRYILNATRLSLDSEQLSSKTPQYVFNWQTENLYSKFYFQIKYSKTSLDDVDAARLYSTLSFSLTHSVSSFMFEKISLRSKITDKKAKIQVQS